MRWPKRDLKRLAQRLGTRYRVVAWLYCRQHVWRHNPIRPDREQVLVYQMGKVGSNAVTHTLREHLPGRSVHHVHILTHAGLRAFAEKARRRQTLPRGIQRHYWVARQVRTHLDRGTLRRPKVVTLVRDPIARNISLFFDVLQHHLGVDPAAEAPRRTPGALVRRLTGLFLRELDDHDMPLTWFDEEFRPVLDLDLLAPPFPSERGWAVHEADRASVLVIKVERLDECATQAFRAFFGVDDIRLKRTNIGDRKHGPIYRRFRERVSLPDAYVERMYASRYARTFYSPRELDTFRERWAATARAGG